MGWEVKSDVGGLAKHHGLWGLNVKTGKYLPRACWGQCVVYGSLVSTYVVCERLSDAPAS